MEALSGREQPISFDLSAVGVIALVDGLPSPCETCGSVKTVPAWIYTVSDELRRAECCALCGRTRSLVSS
jgi:hypothetical protein